MDTELSTKVFQHGQVISRNGTVIGYCQIGSGPGLIILSDGSQSSQHYQRLAAALSDVYAVTILDQRELGISGQARENYSVIKECEDLAAVLQQTKARMVFGHNGSLFALRDAIKVLIDKFVLYEPIVPIDYPLSFDWIPAYEQALARQDYAAAMAWIIKSLRLNWISKLPFLAVRLLFALLLCGVVSREIIANRAKTPFLIDPNSPTFLLNVLFTLVAILPHAQQNIISDHGHTASGAIAPEAVVVKEFLLDQ
jgi:hypothetical protein